MSAIEYRKDFAGKEHYASRNYNSFRQVYEASGGNRATLDWNLTLRQVRKPRTLERGPASMPHLRTMIRSETKEPQAAEHPDGQYLAASATVGCYQNVGQTAHMVRGADGPHSLDWQLNLRDGMHRSAPSVFTSAVSGTKSTRGDDHDSSHTTSQRQSKDKDHRSSAMSVESIRDNPENLERCPGCEGTDVGQWRHLIQDRSRGTVPRAALQSMTMLRCSPHDTSGARITDHRSNACLVEMLGKKKWTRATSHEPLARPFPHGDSKLYHLSNLRPLGEADEVSRQRRRSRHPRRTANPATAERSVPTVVAPPRHRKTAVAEPREKP